MAAKGRENSPTNPGVVIVVASKQTQSRDRYCPAFTRIPDDAVARTHIQDSEVSSHVVGGLLHHSRPGLWLWQTIHARGHYYTARPSLISTNKPPRPLPCLQEAVHRQGCLQVWRSYSRRIYSARKTKAGESCFARENGSHWTAVKGAG